jgi:hypothetical protein
MKYTHPRLKAIQLLFIWLGAIIISMNKKLRGARITSYQGYSVLCIAKAVMHSI